MTPRGVVGVWVGPCILGCMTHWSVCPEVAPPVEWVVSKTVDPQAAVVVGVEAVESAV